MRLHAMIPAANASVRSQSQRELRPRLDSSNAAFLFQFFPARFEHLIVRRFFAAVAHQMFAQGLLFVSIRPWRPMTFGPGNNIPFFGDLSVLVRFLGRIIIFHAHQFLARLELMGVENNNPPEETDENAEVTEEWNVVPGTKGHRAPRPDADEEETLGEHLVSDGREEAAHDQMLERRREELEEEGGITWA